MREYIFRGKRVDNGEWVEGDLMRYVMLEEELVYTCAIRSACIYGVIPESVGEYIGKKDKNGKKIFEGDVLVTSNNGKDGCDKWLEKDYGRTEVIWDNNNSCFCGTKWTWSNGLESVYDLDYVSIIGNIHDGETNLARLLKLRTKINIKT
jgi:uncharacterized phage protein (TIGR01671 family)